MEKSIQAGRLRALLLAREASFALEAQLAACGVHFEQAPTPAEAIQRLASAELDLVLAPVRSPSSLQALAAVHDAEHDTPILAIGEEDDGLLSAALAAGAVEYLAWPATNAALCAQLKRTALRKATSVAASAPAARDADLMGSSPLMVAARDKLARAALGGATVLLRGETGTGKDLAARAIHAQSSRSRAPFVRVHTPAVPDALLESELFGYEKGAFTGATTRKLGRVELAQGGTLFLDEIGDVSPAMQAKLLRLIQDHEFERLGGSRTLSADIRIVAATHRDLEHLVATGQLREDLFYRLNVVSVWLPPLRAHRDDIEAIAMHYLERFSRENGRQLIFEEEALRELCGERWPGNVRQLVNFIERIVVLTPHSRITREDIRREHDEQTAFLTQACAEPEEAHRATSGALAPAAPATALSVAEPVAEQPSLLGEFPSAVRPLKEEVRRTEQRALVKALKFARGNRALAARLLGVSRRTLYTKLDEHGIE